MKIVPTSLMLALILISPAMASTNPYHNNRSQGATLQFRFNEKRLDLSSNQLGDFIEHIVKSFFEIIKESTLELDSINHVDLINNNINTSQVEHIELMSRFINNLPNLESVNLDNNIKNLILYNVAFQQSQHKIILSNGKVVNVMKYLNQKTNTLNINKLLQDHTLKPAELGQFMTTLSQINDQFNIFSNMDQ